MKKYLSLIVLGVFVVGVLSFVANRNIQSGKDLNQGAAQRAQIDANAQALLQAQQVAELNETAKLARVQALKTNNTDFRNKLNFYRNVKSDRKTNAKVLLEETLKARRDNILAVIDENPEAVLADALQPAELVGLPIDLVDKYIEKATTVTDVKMAVMHEDGKVVPGTNTVDINGTRYRYFIENNNATKLTEVHVAGVEKGDLVHNAKTGSRLTLSKAIKIDNQIVTSVSNLQVAYATNGSGGNSPISSSPANTTATSPHSALVIFVNYTDNAPYNSTTISQAQSLMFGTTNSVTGFYKENSYNATNIDTGSVVGPYTIPYSSNAYQNGTLNCNISYVDPNTQTEKGIGKIAVNIAKNNGIVIDGYSNVIVVFPQSSICGYAGVAFVGSPLLLTEQYQPNTMINGFDITIPYMVSVFNHEVGHVYGLPHAHAPICDPGTTYGSASCTNPNSVSYEYGDVYDTMGISVHNGIRTGSPHFNTLYKKRLGWLDNSSISSPTITQVTGSGDYVINKYETGIGAKALAFTEPTSNATYYFENRTGIGYDTGVANGIAIHVAPGYNPNDYTLNFSGDNNFYDSISDSLLIDAHPSTNTQNQLDDALLTAVGATTGDTFTTPESGTTFRLISRDANTATIHVDVQPGCSRKPTVVVTPPAQTDNTGSTYTNSIVVTNNDLFSCAPATFNVKQMFYSGFSETFVNGDTIFSYNKFSPYNVTLSPGQTSAPHVVQATHSTGSIGVDREMGVYVENAVRPTIFSVAKYTLKSTSNDTTPPVISNNSVSNLAINHATINWTTDEGANGEVFYRKTSVSTDSTSGFNGPFVTSHSLNLVALEPNTNYQYKIVSINEAGLSTTSPWYYFTTPNGVVDITIPTVSIVLPTTGTISGAVKFIINATDDVAVTFVKIVNSDNNILGIDYTYPYEIYLDTSNVPPGSINIRAKAYDANNNEGLTGLINYNINNTIQPLNTTQPILSNITAGDITATGAKIQWTTGTVVNGHVNYGTVSGQLTQSGSLNPLMSGYLHIDTLTNLLTNTTYYYTVSSTSPNNLTTTSPQYSFTTLGGVIDNTAPIITTAPTSVPTINGATISWGTDDVSNSQVIWGSTTGSYPYTSPAIQNTTAHTVTLAGLLPNTTYYYKVKSTNATPLSTTSTTEYTFTTLADTIAPTVSMTLPLNGAVVSGNNVILNSTASDNVNIDHVDYYYGTNVIGGGALTPPYSKSWDTTGLTNGTYSLTARAYDTAGNNTTSAPVSVTVNNVVVVVDTTPPTVSITSPYVGDTISGTVNIYVNASDLKNDGITAGKISMIKFFRGTTQIGNDILIATDTTPPFVISWDTTTVANGYRWLSVVAYDDANPANSKQSAKVKVLVNNVVADTTKPSTPTNLTSPSKTSTSVNLSWSPSTDNIAVAGYQVFKDGALIGTTTSPTTTYSATGLTASTTYSFTVKAYDTASPANYSNASTALSVTTNSGTPNNPPLVSAGYDLSGPTTMTIGSSAVNAYVTDADGPAPLTIVWSQVSGPGTVTFSTGNTVQRTATFSQTGNYVLRLTATDGAGASAYDDVLLVVQ